MARGNDVSHVSTACDCTPMHACFPCVASMGKGDPYFAYGQHGLSSVYGQLTWIEHAGGHATAREPEVTEQIAAAVWRAAGYVQPGTPPSSRAHL